jgi:hypothetical protein
MWLFTSSTPLIQDDQVFIEAIVIEEMPGIFLGHILEK